MPEAMRHAAELDQGESEKFDYVVVGAGSAGCVLANRLSEDLSTRVCLVEAGPSDSNPLIHVPLGFLFLMQHRRLNWRYWTTAQSHASGRSIYVPRGRALGGSSSLNGMVYMRGHASDYEEWAAAGATGWSYRDVLPYFLRSENNETWRNSPWHGTQGLLRVAEPRHVNPLVRTFFEAAACRGLLHCPDFNVPAPEGFGLRQVNQRDGWRESSATAFLKPALKRANLTVVVDGMVDRVLMTGKRAAGVELLVKGGRRKLMARRQVVLCAGSIGSPLILMRSGIGDGPELQRHGIDVVHHLPEVGRNYQDHPSSEVRYSSPVPISYGISMRTLPKWAWGFAQYAASRRGPLTSAMVYGSAFVRSSPSVARPDLQLVFLPARRPPRGILAWGHGFGVIPIILKPRSRGRISLGGTSPTAPPKIDPMYLSDGADIELMLKALKIGREVLESAPFDPYRGEELAPGANLRSDDDLRQFIRDSLGTAQHPVGTCRMGGDMASVVDPQLRVRGVDNLVVADASVMPTLIAGNTHAPVVMIAEKASDLIRGRSLPAAALDWSVNGVPG